MVVDALQCQVNGWNSSQGSVLVRMCSDEGEVQSLWLAAARLQPRCTYQASEKQRPGCRKPLHPILCSNLSMRSWRWEWARPSLSYSIGLPPTELVKPGGSSIWTYHGRSGINGE